MYNHYLILAILVSIVPTKTQAELVTFKYLFDQLSKLDQVILLVRKRIDSVKYYQIVENPYVNILISDRERKNFLCKYPELIDQWLRRILFRFPTRNINQVKKVVINRLYVASLLYNKLDISLFISWGGSAEPYGILKDYLKSSLIPVVNMERGLLPNSIRISDFGQQGLCPPFQINLKSFKCESILKEKDPKINNKWKVVFAGNGDADIYYRSILNETSFPKRGDRDKQILASLKELGLNVIYAPHPLDISQGLFEKPPGTTKELIGNCDLFITCGSHTEIDAYLADIPIILISNGFFWGSGVAVEICDFKDLNLISVKDAIENWHIRKTKINIYEYQAANESFYQNNSKNLRSNHEVLKLFNKIKYTAKHNSKSAIRQINQIFKYRRLGAMMILT